MDSLTVGVYWFDKNSILIEGDFIYNPAGFTATRGVWELFFIFTFKDKNRYS